MPTILVVEDSRFLRIADERILVKAGYRVIVVGDGEEALRVAAENLPDAILLDMMLPKMAGPEVLQALKTNLATADVPVIILTSLSQENEESFCQAGALALLEKESLLYDHQPLLDAVDRASKSIANRKFQSTASAGVNVPKIDK